MKNRLFRRFWLLTLTAGVLIVSLRAEDPAPPAEPGPGAARFAEAVELFSRGENESAYRAFLDARKADPSLPPAGVAAALLSKQQGDLTGAHDFLARAIAESPEDPEPWYRLAELAADDKRLPELGLLREKADTLLAAFERSESGKTSPRLPFLRSLSVSLSARALEAVGDISAAERKMREYIKLNPESAEGYLSLGYLQFQQNKLDESRESFARAKELAPALYAGWLAVASLLEEKGETEKALALAEEHLSDPGLTVLELSRVARMFYRRGKLDQARQAADRIPPKTLDRLRWDALLAYSGGDFEKAASLYREALRLAPNDFDVISGLALALADQEKASLLPEAFEKTDRLRRDNPRSDEAAGTLAWVEFRRGNLSRAEDILLPILDRGGLTPTAAFYLASIVSARGENDLAIQLLTSALAQPAYFPKRPAAEKLLDSLTK